MSERRTTSENRAIGKATFAEVMTFEGSPTGTPFEASVADFAFARLWSRPGLSRRDRRLATITCVAAHGIPGPLNHHVYAALNSGDISYDEMLEFVLHFAVYGGWEKATQFGTAARDQQARIDEARGETPRAKEDVVLGGEPREDPARIYEVLTGSPAIEPVTPFLQVGFFDFVCGEIWQRPHLSIRDRRVITLAAVVMEQAEMGTRTYVRGALTSGDLSLEELEELALHLTVYANWPKAAFLDVIVREIAAELGQG